MVLMQRRARRAALSGCRCRDSLLGGPSWQASAGVRDEKKNDKRSKLRALAPIMSYLGSWRLSRAQGELLASIYSQMMGFF